MVCVPFDKHPHFTAMSAEPHARIHIHPHCKAQTSQLSCQGLDIQS